MPYFNRFDICEAHALIERDYHVNGILRERPSNERRSMSTAVQLVRMGFRPSPLLDGIDDLTENGREIYRELARHYGLASTVEASR